MNNSFGTSSFGVEFEKSQLSNLNVKKISDVANDIGNNFAKAIFQILVSFGLCKKDKFLDLTSRSRTVQNSKKVNFRI